MFQKIRHVLPQVHTGERPLEVGDDLAATVKLGKDANITPTN